jgi:hypothetical protein
MAVGWFGHGWRVGAESYLGRVFGNRNKYLSADRGSALNPIIAADGVLGNAHHIAVGGAGQLRLVNQNKLTDADIYFIPGPVDEGNDGAQLRSESPLGLYTNAAIAGGRTA